MRTTGVHIFSPNKQPQCESTEFTSLRQWWLRLSPLTTCSHAFRVFRAGLSAYNSALTARLSVSLILMLAVAPLMSKAYFLFPQRPIDDTWFYGNLYYFFASLSNNFALIIFLTGVWFMFNDNQKRRYIMIGPLGYFLGDTIYKILITENTPESNAAFLSTAPFIYLVYGVGLIVTSLLLINYALYLYNHVSRKFDAQLDGIANLPINDSEKGKLMLRAYKEDKERTKQFK